jgi:D-alanine-D-alanine ligase
MRLKTTPTSVARKARVVKPRPRSPGLRPSAHERHPGRVANLEAYVRPDWWRMVFDELYLKIDGDLFENERNTRAEVDAIVAAAGLRPSDRVLDLCCGQGRHSLELARRGFRGVTGLDQSGYLIGLARHRARAANLEVSFLEGDARCTQIAEASFDCVVILGNSFGYFERAEDDAQLLRQARLALHESGRLVLDLVDVDWLRAHFELRYWEWLDDRLLVCRERLLAADGERLITREIVLDVEDGVVSDRFYAERFYRRAVIERLLESVGFTAIRFRGATELLSDRNGDLGMMARRQLVLACAVGAGRAHRAP